MEYVGLILNLADNIVEIYKDEKLKRHQVALFELRKRYEIEKNKDQIDCLILDSIELDIMRYCEFLDFEIRKQKATDLQK